ncbi:DUF7417 domain-containing protein [Streptomyces niveus]
MGRMKDIAIDLMDYEAGELNARETLELFGVLINSGMAWTLQGAYGRMASELIETGCLTAEGEISESASQVLDKLDARAAS